MSASASSTSWPSRSKELIVRRMSFLITQRCRVSAHRYASFVYTASPDFNYKSFRTTNVIRWEYRPGSTLFVLSQQSREDIGAYGDFRFGRDFAGIFALPPRNVLLVKLAYWFNF